MSRLSFLDDYSEGCHPRVLEVLAQGNLAVQPGYGADDFMKKPFSRAEVFARIERLLDAEGVPRRAHLRGPVPEPAE